jgi:hypothetical protein
MALITVVPPVGLLTSSLATSSDVEKQNGSMSGRTATVSPYRPSVSDSLFHSHSMLTGSPDIPWNPAHLLVDISHHKLLTNLWRNGELVIRLRISKIGDVTHPCDYDMGL